MQLKPFDKVLTRDNAEQKWSINIFSRYDYEKAPFIFVCLLSAYKQCVPYNGNEHLLNTKDSPDGDFKVGDKVVVSDCLDGPWESAYFISTLNASYSTIYRVVPANSMNMIVGFQFCHKKDW